MFCKVFARCFFGELSGAKKVPAQRGRVRIAWDQEANIRVSELLT